MRDPQSITVNEDERLIPVWSIVAAVRGLCAGGVLFLAGFARQHNIPPPLGFRIYFNISWGLLAALYFLMVGYVSKDAPRRAMSPRFWIADLLCDAGRHRRGALLPAAPAGGFPLPGLLDRTCRAISIFARSATISSRPVAATASAPCAPPISSAPGAAMSWPRTTCRRGCGCWASKQI